MSTNTFGRRTAIGGTAALAAGAALTACSSGSGDAAPAAGGASSTAAATTKATAIGSAPASWAAPSAAAGGTALTSTSDVAVGGGVILPDAKLVVTQPTAGEFKAFSAVCTHQGCLVGSIEGSDIVCPCHSSKFSITDGSVVAGPATAPLAPTSITVSGTDITLA